MTTQKEKEALPKVNDLKRQIKALEEKYENLRATVGYEELHGWTPNPKIETQYGWIFAWLYPLYSYLNNNGETSPDVRNKIIAIVQSIISQLVIYAKYGVKIPNEPKESDNGYFDKQVKYYELNYDACEICGENRITHYCHIIPKAEGGANSIENFVILCPLHHHLFDNHRLNQSEWEILSKALEKKMPSAYIYAKEVREKRLCDFWTQPTRKYPQ